MGPRDVSRLTFGQLPFERVAPAGYILDFHVQIQPDGRMNPKLPYFAQVVLRIGQLQR